MSNDPNFITPVWGRVRCSTWMLELPVYPIINYKTVYIHNGKLFQSCVVILQKNYHINMEARSVAVFRGVRFSTPPLQLHSTSLRLIKNLQLHPAQKLTKTPYCTRNWSSSNAKEKHTPSGLFRRIVRSHHINAPACGPDIYPCRPVEKSLNLVTCAVIHSDKLVRQRKSFPCNDL